MNSFWAAFLADTGFERFFSNWKNKFNLRLFPEI